jgi:hypothetical protein
MLDTPNARSKPLSIDAALLERMGMLARGFPGRTVSLARPPERSDALVEKVVLHLDGVAADEIVASELDEPNDAA